MRKFYRLKPGVILKKIADDGEAKIQKHELFAILAYRRLHAIILTRKTGIKLEPQHGNLFSLEFGVSFDHDECDEITDEIDLDIKKAQWRTAVNDENPSRHYHDIDWPVLN